jgi:dolichol-phosphate mannosyltransferase
VSAPHEQNTFTDLGKVLVIIPTYNESDNIEGIVGRLRAAAPDVDVLVADDNSPDGTGEIADALAEHDPHVQVLHRKGKEGLGAAYLAGFHWGIDRGYDILVEMDADGSHSRSSFPACWRRSGTPTWCWGRAGCRAARS